MHYFQKFCLVISLSLFVSPAFAYIDPNTGGYLFQLLAPLLALAISAWMFFSNQVKAIWHSIRRLFSRKSHKKS